MKIIFSNIKSFDRGSVPDNLYYLEMAALSNYFVKSNGFETIFFGDEDSLKEFKNIEYDHFQLINKKEIDIFPKCMWSMGKLVALTKVNEPVLHVDMDLFFNKLDHTLINKDIICLHSEMFIKDMPILQELFEIRPRQAEGFDVVSYNCGIIGGKDYITINKSINILFNFINDNYDYINKIYNQYKNIEKYGSIFFPAVLAEQIWLFQIFKYFNKEISCYVNINKNHDWIKTYDCLFKNNIIHLMHRKYENGWKEILSEKARSLNLKF